MSRITLELLLSRELPQAETKTLKIKRLSKHYGVDFDVVIKAIPYNKVREIKDINSTPMSDLSLAIILEGVVSPDLRSAELMARYKVPTPNEVLPLVFTAGEIDDIQCEVEKLSGYRTSTLDMVKDIKKK